MALVLSGALAGCGGGSATPLELRTLNNRADMVSGGDALVEVVLPATVYNRIRRGETATVTPEAPGGRYTATVTLVDRVIDAASGTFGVRLELPNPNLAIPAGAKCKVRFKH